MSEIVSMLGFVVIVLSVTTIIMYKDNEDFSGNPMIRVIFISGLLVFVVGLDLRTLDNSIKHHQERISEITQEKNNRINELRIELKGDVK